MRRSGDRPACSDSCGRHTCQQHSGSAQPTRRSPRSLNRYHCLQCSQLVHTSQSLRRMLGAVKVQGMHLMDTWWLPRRAQLHLPSRTVTVLSEDLRNQYLYFLTSYYNMIQRKYCNRKKFTFLLKHQFWGSLLARKIILFKISVSSLYNIGEKTTRQILAKFETNISTGVSKLSYKLGLHEKYN